VLLAVCACVSVNWARNDLRPSDTINSAIPLRTRANGNVIGIKTIREILRQYPVRRVAAVFTRVSIEHLSEIAPEVAMVRGANTDLWKAVNALGCDL